MTKEAERLALIQRLAGLAEASAPELRRLLVATWTVLIRKGILDERDMQAILGDAATGGAGVHDAAAAPSDRVLAAAGGLLSSSELVDEASDDSFPASDPPSFMGAGRVGSPAAPRSGG